MKFKVGDIIYIPQYNNYNNPATIIKVDLGLKKYHLTQVSLKITTISSFEYIDKHCKLASEAISILYGPKRCI